MWEWGKAMMTLRITLDEALVEEVDQVAYILGMTRSVFTRNALRAALDEFQERELERKHREGYKRYPVQPGELSDWEDEQIWPD